MKQLELNDAEFGTIVVHCNPRAKRVVLRLLPSGTVRITIPHQRNIADAEKLVNDARSRIRNQRANLIAGRTQYQPGAVVGRSHQLNFRAEVQARGIITKVTDGQIIVKFPIDLAWNNDALQEKIHEAAKKALRQEAQNFLPQRVSELAQQWGYDFKKVRISSGHTRWGSCSSDGTISLNLWLMDLPDELVTYVICHELCHTVQHNHSDRFWALVASHLPDYKSTRKELKAIHPR